MSEQRPSWAHMILGHSLFYSCRAVMPRWQVSIIRPRLPAGKSPAGGRGSTTTSTHTRSTSRVCQAISPRQKTRSVGTKHVCRDGNPTAGPLFCLVSPLAPE